ncbi:hypothetical protein [uncultured Campylobacter sp.]|uniref:hypothetical protein n=1 Tax=uncultured Campylobacter sp. TaxID=218934 RepID=UPI0026146467|nr:hypothetical protein [uncultured Campylobacter sp.]
MLFARHAEQRKKLKFYDIKFSRRGILKFTSKTPGFKIPPLRNSKFRNIKFTAQNFKTSPAPIKFCEISSALCRIGSKAKF